MEAREKKKLNNSKFVANKKLIQAQKQKILDPQQLVTWLTRLAASFVVMLLFVTSKLYNRFFSRLWISMRGAC